MRRIAANYIYTGTQVLKNSLVVLSDEGVVLDLVDTGGQLRESQGVEFYNGVLVPGFVNCHCHLELSALKSVVPPAQGLPSFLQQMIGRPPLDASLVTAAASRADRWMRANGIVAVGDVMNTEAVIGVAQASEMRYHHFIEAMGVSRSRSESTFRWAAEVFERLRLLSQCSVVPHAPYSVCRSLLSAIQQHSTSNRTIFSIHHQETPTEIDLIRGKTGGLYDKLTALGIDYSIFDLQADDPLRSIAAFLPTGQNILLVHNTFVDEKQILFAKELDFHFFWVVCPLSNQYLEGRLPDLDLLKRMGCTIAIGTDSLASNTILSVLEEMKAIMGNFPDVTLEDVVSWACLNGAQALGFQEELGSIAPGKKPGLNLIYDLDLRMMRLTKESKIKVII